MNSESVAAPVPMSGRSGLHAAVIAIAIGLAVLGLLFEQEVVAAVSVWLQSTAYNHCFLVTPIAAYLVWDRRERLAGVVPRPAPIAALLAIPVSMVWLLADRLGIMEGRQLMAMTMVELLFLGVLGWRVYWILLGPLLYLYFLVPFGYVLTPALQNFTTSFVGHGLDLFGIPNYINAHIIEIPEGSFFVAEACAGLRFLIASVAFGALYSLLIYRSNLRRIVFMGVSVVVPVIANGIRALGIVMLGHYLGSAQAAETDHILYGWLFFSIVTLLLIVLGLPFRQDRARPERRRLVPAAPAAAPRRSAADGRALVSAMLVLMVAAIGPLAAAQLDQASAAERPALPGPLTAAPCQQVGTTKPIEATAPGRGLVQHLACPAGGVAVTIERFSPRADPREIVKEEARIVGLDGADSVNATPVTVSGLTWRLLETQDPARTAAAALLVGGRSESPGLAMRLHQAWASIVGSRTAPVLIAVAPAPDPSGLGAAGRRDAVSRIASYLHSHPMLGREIARLSKSPEDQR